MSAVFTVLLMFSLTPFASDSAQVLGFQSNLPERKPDYWIRSDRGGQVEFGGIQAVLPAEFTQQGGASVFGDVVQSSGFDKPLELLSGTEFAFGIWPTQVQLDYPKPIEFRVWLNAADFPAGGEETLYFMMYDPAQNYWQRIPSEFDPGTYQIVAEVQSFTPVSDDFPDWGGRTFFGLFFPSELRSVASPPGTPGVSRVRTNANLRAGPGIHYAITGYAPAGTALDAVASDADGTWLRMSDDNWIAARLVDGVPPLPTSIAIPPTPTESERASTPRPTSTRKSSATPTPSPTSETKAKISFDALADGELLDLDVDLPENSGDADLAVFFSEETISLVLINNATASEPVSLFGKRELCVQTESALAILDVDPERLPLYVCLTTSEGNLASISVRSSRTTTETLRILSTVWTNELE